ncbi:hypothetical protein SLEP1_g30596 [Rubroshorea leprosula]|uniref:Uncharacterized protein n=1 Tax=Rubroshorea leprosula TaxID=152421 RepID=A0AAV5K303_9ROSI|nr:hypothetical protein SLEP1_g30596 [Rubroshorea leprosula]
MMESTGMVLVQSLKELQRTSRIVNELRAVFASVEAIPVQVLLTGYSFLCSCYFPCRIPTSMQH